MKTREELEKMFDEKYFIFTERQKQDMKDFWFKNIIPKVLKSVMYRNERIPSNNMNYLESDFSNYDN